MRLKLNIFVLITNKMQKTSTFVIVPMVTLRCVEMVHGDGQFSQGAIYIDTWTLSPVFERRTSRWLVTLLRALNLVTHCYCHYGVTKVLGHPSNAFVLKIWTAKYTKCTDVKYYCKMVNFCMILNDYNFKFDDKMYQSWILFTPSSYLFRTLLINNLDSLCKAYHKRASWKFKIIHAFRIYMDF